MPDSETEQAWAIFTKNKNKKQTKTTAKSYINIIYIVKRIINPLNANDETSLRENLIFL